MFTFFVLVQAKEGFLPHTEAVQKDWLICPHKILSSIVYYFCILIDITQMVFSTQPCVFISEKTGSAHSTIYVPLAYIYMMCGCEKGG